jgi:hypothetical protein
MALPYEFIQILYSDNGTDANAPDHPEGHFRFRHPRPPLMRAAAMISMTAPVFESIRRHAEAAPWLPACRSRHLRLSAARCRKYWARVWPAAGSVVALAE